METMYKAYRLTHSKKHALYVVISIMQPMPERSHCSTGKQFAPEKILRLPFRLTSLSRSSGLLSISPLHRLLLGLLTALQQIQQFPFAINFLANLLHRQPRCLRQSSNGYLRHGNWLCLSALALAKYHSCTIKPNSMHAGSAWVFLLNMQRGGQLSPHDQSTGIAILSTFIVQTSTCPNHSGLGCNCGATAFCSPANIF